MGESLGSATRQNTRLQSLDLAGNNISDSGATSLANGLRLNRTLLVLNLAANGIGDVGASQLAVVLSPFELTHDEVVERRRLHRVQRVRAQNRQLGGKLSARRVSSSGQSVGHQRGRKRAGGSPADHGKTGKQTGKTTKSPRAAQADDGKVKKEKTGAKTKKTAFAHAGRGQESSETSHVQDKSLASGRDAHRLLSVDVLRASSVEQPTTLVRGNRTLISLNLSRNEIGQVGMTALLDSVLVLSRDAVPTDPLMPGLMRITVHNNRAYRTPAGTVTHSRWSTASVGADTGRQVDTTAHYLAVAISSRDPLLRHSGPTTSKLVPTSSNPYISVIEA